jgi:hypothetical protein
MRNRNAVIFLVVLLIIILVGILAYRFLPVEKKQTENIVKIQEEPVAEKPVVLTTEDKIKKIAEDWITKVCPTYKFDGSELTFINLSKLNFDDCPNCYVAVYEFKSGQPTTPHSITLLISDSNVTRAVTDGKYDEVNKSFINLTE